MVKKVLTDLNLNKNEIQNVSMQNIAGAPSSPVAGQFWFDTTENAPYYFNGTNNVVFGSTYVLPPATTTTLGGIIVGSNLSVTSDGTLSIADASTSTKGVIEIATDEEAATGTSTSLAVTPKQLATKIGLTDLSSSATGLTYTNTTGVFSLTSGYEIPQTATLNTFLVGSDVKVDSSITKTADSSGNGFTLSVGNASTSAKGIIEIATDTEAETGTATDLAVTPKQLATKLTANTAITAGTHTKITYDSKGLVTSGADLQASDIPDLTLSKITDVTASADELNILDGVTASTAELNILDGVTATAAEINVLDGITATTTELNYVSGVTSAIQTQIDNKVTKNADITAGTKCKITYDAKGLVTGGADLAASDIPDLSETYVNVDQIGVANGIASLGSDGKVPAAQLPSFVDDVIDSYIVSGSTAFSAGWLSATDGGDAFTPETGKIYVVLTTGEYLNKTYRWSGTVYVEISASPAQATESAAGIAAIATQAEVNTGTNDTKFVTPLKLATYTNGMAKKATVTNPALTVSGGICTWTITNNISDDATILIKEVSTGDECIADVSFGAGIITVKMNSTADISAGTYKAVIIG